MITNLEVTNFRNLSHLELNFKEKCSILTGANGIGKSNALNSINWILTDTLLTDKWGAGENDLNSIFPVNYIKGQEPSVEITLENGVKLKKMFVKGKNGNNTEYYVNGVKEKTKKGFEDSLYKNLGFEKKLKCEKEVNELRLFTDPLYTLQKLDAKALRTLLVELGCSVTNEDVFNLHPEFNELRSYEQKYQNDYTKMRAGFKADRQELKKQLDSIPFLLESYAGPDFEPEIREELEQKKQELINKKTALENNTSNIDYNNQIKELRNKKELFIAFEHSKIMAELAVLGEKKKRLKNNADSSQNEELKAINAKIQNLGEKLTALNELKKSYSSSKVNCRTDAIEAKKNVDELLHKREALEINLKEINKRVFVGYVTCPDCGKVFVADESALVLFNKQKQDDTENIKDQIAKIEISIKEKEKFFNEAYEKGIEAKKQEEAQEEKINEIKTEIEALNLEKTKVAAKPVDTSKIKEIEDQITELQNRKIDTSNYDLEIEKLTQKMSNLNNTNSSEYLAEIETLSSNIEDIEAQIKEQYTIEAKEKSRKETIAKQDEIIFKLNEIDHLLELVNGFIHTKIKYMNQKAKELTGLEFVMLEENISNDGVKEVCYPTVDGVEFSNVNTSQKLAVGIKFIHKLKEILGSNDLPILADRLEGFDDIEKIKAITTEQMICTVVGNKEQKEIVII